MERVSEERENLSAGLGSTKVLNDESERKLVSYFIDSRVFIVFYLCVCLCCWMGIVFRENHGHEKVVQGFS